MSDLKVYCTKNFYFRYMMLGHLIACSPGTRNKLLLEDRDKNEDLNVRLSLDRKKHKINRIKTIGRKEKPVVGKWYEIIRS